MIPEITESILNSNNLCRTCLSIKQVCSVFVTHCGGISVLQMLRECLNHEVEETDALPKSMCLSCVAILYQTHNFLNLCKISFNRVHDFMDIQRHFKEEHCYAKETNKNKPSQDNLEITAEKLRDTQISLIQCYEENNDAVLNQNDDLVDITENPVFDPTENKKTKIVNMNEKNKENKVIKSQTDMKICYVCDKNMLPHSLIRHLKTHLILKSLQKGYTCMKCKVNYKSVAELKEHCETESHLFKTCLTCNKTFTNLLSHYKHMQLHQEMGSSNNTPITILRKSRKQKKFTCKVCDVEFEGFSDIYSHYQAYHYDSTDCIICQKKYILARRVRYHINSHSDKKFSCYPCKVAFDNREELDKHKQSEGHVNRKKCSICFKSFRNKHRLAIHMQSHKEEKPFQCDECGKQFSYKSSFGRHKARHAGMTYICDACGKAFTTKYAMDLHKYNSHGAPCSTSIMRRSTTLSPSDTQVCEICGYVSKSKKLNLLHSAFHKYKHTKICPKCNQTYLNISELNKHLESSHKMYKCVECPRQFVFNGLLKRHILTHQWQTRDDVDSLDCCRLCATQCNNQDELIKHIVEEHHIHPCVECKKCFMYKSMLVQHNRRKHLGMYKYNCSFCDKGFDIKQLMESHEHIHTGYKPYVCEICQAGFRQKPHLISHMLTHTGEKPYNCRFCNKAFAHLTTRITHERIHTGEKPYTCNLCNRGFYHSSTMKKHRLTHYK